MEFTMRLSFYISEYSEKNSVAINTEFEDGTSHCEIVEKLLEAVSVLYGYNIKEEYAHSSSDS